MPVIRLSSLLLLLLVFNFAAAQTFTPLRDSNIVSGSNGYYEYLPQGYNAAASTVYPLIIFLHGQEDLGDGDADLNLLLSKGLPKVIQDGQFPTSFTVGGQTHQFIVLCPQFINDAVDQPSPQEVDDIIDFAIEKYKVNQNRIYITGLSLGGGATWDYAGESSANANRIAGIVPVAAFSQHSGIQSQIIGEADLPVWATHNNGDPTASAAWTIEYVDLINTFNPTPLAKRTIFISPLHEGWTTTYDPTFRENGVNIYEWMLQYQRSVVALPVALTNYKAVVNGSAVVVSWSTSSELNNAFFTIERSANGVDFTSIGKVTGLNQPGNYTFRDVAPLTGDGYYRLSQTDADGRTTYYKVLQVRMKETLTKGFNLYPNPAKNNVTLLLTTEQKGAFTVSVIGVNGVRVKQWVINKSTAILEESLPLQGLPSGKYVLQVSGKSFAESKSFLKE